MRQVEVDGGEQFADVAEAAFADQIIGELAKKALDQAQPGGASRCKSALGQWLPGLGSNQLSRFCKQLSEP